MTFKILNPEYHSVKVCTNCVEKVSQLKLYLPRQKGTMNETLIFFKILDVLKQKTNFS